MGRESRARPLNKWGNPYVSGAFRDEIGTAIHGHADINGDGHLDLLAYGCCADGASAQFVGVLFGVFATSSFTSRSAAEVDFSIKGDDANDFWGDSQAVGDLNGDGFDDFAVGLTRWNSKQGRVYVYFGASALPSGTAAATASLLIPGAAGTTDAFGIVAGR